MISTLTASLSKNDSTRGSILQAISEAEGNGPEIDGLKRLKVCPFLGRVFDIVSRDGEWADDKSRTAALLPLVPKLASSRVDGDLQLERVNRVTEHVKQTLVKNLLRSFLKDCREAGFNIEPISGLAPAYFSDYDKDHLDALDAALVDLIYNQDSTDQMSYVGSQVRVCLTSAFWARKRSWKPATPDDPYDSAHELARVIMAYGSAGEDVLESLSEACKVVVKCALD